MWIIRFLNGPLAGQIVPLTKHSVLIGRAPNCDIKIASPSISKEHTKIEIFDDKVIITDAGSRNGTFVNGVQVRSSKGKTGDKIAMHDVYFEVQKVPDSWRARFAQPMHVYGQQPQMQPMGAAAYQMQPADFESEEASASANVLADLMQGKFPRFATLAQSYMDRVVLPGVVKLPEMFDFKWVLAGFMAGFIILVTALSMIPLSQILRTSLEEESQQHALTIASTLARVNRGALQQGLETSVSVDIATQRPGVKKAYIINNLDGNIVAPAAQAGSFPDMPYIMEGRKTGKESVYQADANTVIALYPIEFYNAETGSHAVTHWAVVLYDMSSLAVDNGRVLSLFITTLFIALLLGAVLFYFLYKVIEFPIRSINVQLDTALKEGLETVHVSYKFPAYQLLASNVSSALTRAVNGAESNGANRAVEHDRNREIGNMVQLVGFAAMGIRAADLSIAAVNSAFEARAGNSAAILTTMTVNELADQALKLSIKDLIERVDANPDEIASNDLEFSGLEFQVVAQSVFGSAKIAYYLIVLLPKGESE
jgi:hypothetical protein